MRPIPLLLLGILAMGCDRINDPLVAPGTNTGGTGTVTRKVLLEDFTGHRCNNCPAAARVAAQLQQVHGDDLIVMGVHCTENFASPADPPYPDGRYSTDFRTEAGNTYETSLGITYLPLGAVSRHRFNGPLLLGSAAWSSAVAEIIGQEADLDIWFSQLQHNPSNNTVSAEVKVAVLRPVTGDHNLTICLTEDHVVDWQYDGGATPPDVPDYVHRHVLRNTVNGTWGVPLIVGAANPGDTITLSYPNFALNPSWVADNCSLVAYAYSTSSEEILQVTERKFRP